MKGSVRLIVFTLLALMALGLFASSALAKPAGNLDQIRNGSATSPISPANWVNGNAGASQAHYAEGFSIAYRDIMTGLTVGDTIVLTLDYEIRHGGKNAIDYLTSYNRLEPHTPFGHPAEVIDPLLGITLPANIVASPDYYLIPKPASGSGGQPGDSYDDLPTEEKQMVLWGGNITSIVYGPQGDLTADIAKTQVVVTFTVTNSTAVLAWGGHIASQLDWGLGNSASSISGSPYHMAQVGWTINGLVEGLGAQDRSLAASAVYVPEADLDVQKFDNPTTLYPTLTGQDPIYGGETQTYTIKLVNHGPDPADGVYLVDTLGAGLSYVPGSAKFSYGMISNATITPTSLSPLTFDVSAAIGGNGQLPVGTFDPAHNVVTITFQALVADSPPWRHTGPINGGYTAPTVGTYDRLNSVTAASNTIENVADLGNNTYYQPTAVIPAGGIPDIVISKTTYGSTAGVLGYADGVTILLNGAVDWQYEITLSPGSVQPLGSILVTDDNGTTSNLLDDFSPVLYSKNGGDTDNLLEVGETWVYRNAAANSGTATIPDMTPPPSYTNTAKATGVFEEITQDGSDTSWYYGADPAIQVVKYVWDGDSWEDANSITGPYLLNVAPNPLFKFVITNTGNVQLTSVTLTDTDVSNFFTDEARTIPASFPIASLDPGTANAVTFYGHATWAANQQSDTATVEGYYGTLKKSDTDDAFYYGAKQTGYLLPTQTTLQDYLHFLETGELDPPMYDNFSYQVTGDATTGYSILSVAPGVIFYYNTISAPVNGDFTFTVRQHNSAGWKPMTVQGTKKTLQAYVYSAADYSVVARGSADGFSSYIVTFTVKNAVEGDIYYVGIKYTPGNLAGQLLASPGDTSWYYFETWIGDPAAQQVGGDDSIQVIPKL